jgi:hypothetical protein
MELLPIILFKPINLDAKVSWVMKVPEFFATPTQNPSQLIFIPKQKALLHAKDMDILTPEGLFVLQKK